MNKEHLEKAFSTQRVEPYYHNIKKDSDGLNNFNKNKTLSTLFYIPLSVFEIVLRNSIHTELGSKWRNLNSLESWQNNISNRTSINRTFTNRDNEQLSYLARKINKKRIGSPNSRDIIKTEFPSLGFYLCFFHKDNMVLFSKIITKPFLKKLNYINKAERIKLQSSIYNDFNNIRKLRNRIYHYESLRKYSIEELSNIANNLYYYIEIINQDAFIWLEKRKPLKQLLKEVKKYKS